MESLTIHKILGHFERDEWIPYADHEPENKELKEGDVPLYRLYINQHGELCQRRENAYYNVIADEDMRLFTTTRGDQHMNDPIRGLLPEGTMLEIYDEESEG